MDVSSTPLTPKTPIFFFPKTRIPNQIGMANWNVLPRELSAIIGGYINTYADYIRFRAVCPPWRSSLPKWPNHLYSRVPCLMLPLHHPNHQNLRSFYNPLNHELFYLDWSEARDQFCCGSSNGWLVTLENGLTLKLLNPLTKSQIHLPPISSFPNVVEYDNPNRPRNEYLVVHPTINNFTLSQALIYVAYLDKIVFSSCPCSNGFLAVAIHGKFSKLSFFKFGDDKWTAIHTSSSICFQDCITFYGKIYAINAGGELMVSSIDTPTEMVNMGLRRPKLTKGSKLYLVKTDDELLMVERLLTIEIILVEDWNCCNYKTIGFNLFKLDSRKERFGWFKINNLDDYTIFLGLNTSICISSRYCPRLNGNHIYYTDDQMERHIEGYLGGHDFGIFDITNKSCRSLLHDDRHLSLLVWPPPIWVTLNPC